MNSELAWEIAETSHALRRYYDRRAQGLGITRAQWRVLALLRREPGQKQVCLADRLDIEPITLSRIVDRLEEQGLVLRRPDPADRRAWRLELTPAAQPVTAQLLELAHEMAGEAFDQLGEDDIASLTRILSRIRTNVAECEEGRRKVA